MEETNFPWINVENLQDICSESGCDELSINELQQRLYAAANCGAIEIGCRLSPEAVEWAKNEPGMVLQNMGHGMWNVRY